MSDLDLPMSASERESLWPELGEAGRRDRIERRVGGFSTRTVCAPGAEHTTREEGERRWLDYQLRRGERIAAGGSRQDQRASDEDIRRYRRQGWNE
jgi:hypothetical protein